MEDVYIYILTIFIYMHTVHIYIVDIWRMCPGCVLPVVSLSLSQFTPNRTAYRTHTHTQTGFFTVYCTRFHCCCVPPRERESVIVSLNWCDEDSERFIFCPRGKIIQERKINFPGA